MVGGVLNLHYSGPHRTDRARRAPGTLWVRRRYSEGRVPSGCRRTLHNRAIAGIEKRTPYCRGKSGSADCGRSQEFSWQIDPEKGGSLEWIEPTNIVVL